jgi:hypothetical protein
MDRWKAGEEIHESIKTLIGNHHPHLADISNDIVVIFKEKASRKAGCQPVLGKTSKASPLLSLLGDRKYQFIIELSADTWIKLSDDQKTALLDHQLSFIGGEEDEKTAEMKYYLVQPDISYFAAEVTRNGYWRPDLSEPEATDEEGNPTPPTGGGDNPFDDFL